MKRVLRNPAIVLIHPNASSIRLRMRWLWPYLRCRVVRPSMAEKRALRATCGRTFIVRSSSTKSAVSYPLSAPSVIAHGRSANGSIISTAANRSAWPDTSVSRASTIRPERFSISPVADEAELRLHAGTLAIEHRLRVGRGAVRLVRALFTLELDRRVAPATGVVRRRIVGTVPRLEGLHGRPRFDQRAVDAEMLTG